MAVTTIRLPLGVTGWNVYTRLFNESGQIWNSTTSAFVTYIVANVAHFDLATPETPSGSGTYVATMPVGSAAGAYTWEQYKRVGADPVIGDPFAGSGGDYWNGTAFAPASAGTVTLPNPAPLTYGPVGTGSQIVDENYPDANDLRYQLVGGQGIGGALVRAYLASEYATNPNTATVRGQTITLDTGGWANVMLLDPGSYKIVFRKDGYESLVVPLTVPAP